MGAVVPLPLGGRVAPDLLEELLNGMADGFNRLVDIGRVDEASARIMLGYFTAGSMALHCNGLDEAADDFLQAARALQRDRRSFEATCRWLSVKFGR